MTDLKTTVPLVALSEQTKDLISTLLNPRKFLPCDDGLPRDWRGLAHLLGIGGEEIPAIASKPDPCSHILTIMQGKKKDWKIKDLQMILERLDRWDIIDDTEPLLEKDIQRYLERMENLSTVEQVEEDTDRQMLTIDDLYRYQQGLEKQFYDAFLLYADEDENFAIKMIEQLENKFNLKLCIKDRDLMGGVTFEHEAIMQLISERCNRLIVIVSPNFLKSAANKFFLNYAQAIGIDKRQRKVIPCLYQKCDIPPQLSYTFILDYNRVGLFDFWDRLRDSVRIPTATKNKSISHAIQINQSEMKKSFEDNFSTEVLSLEENCNKEKNMVESTVDALPAYECNETSKCNFQSTLKYQCVIKRKCKGLFGIKKKQYDKKVVRTPQICEPHINDTNSKSLPSLNHLSLSSLTLASIPDKKCKKNFVVHCKQKVQRLLAK
ncbi:myeloid differentiation primary response protein MyD88 [Cephus cinctus]|uniref:Myeloid differentiation primary response protein MyD88 n=1 Tax=Cephus cinctus TaxID=211228 RepID=A0AAJ7C1V8_CEPCN|nr:myeloid differentiation primary response protein MyD88 [Cephus cinctus]XP_015599932.1 myeloid differentiation primary response protein MyD88 [Cephus cinctus]XP_015599940.1 myeloid differentiation primary response protein MyD88 [Cephus cinctus]XP_015599949.1 myeloid differentiation primary response protein MyD88 [Cephus cinctus]XP_024943553.1 myeloid differentiation primary response protein MyD88 [Cephus cinctus]XP_024943557.1 myeloid differentiation primary response protein MyD88 [Cephus ci